MQQSFNNSNNSPSQDCNHPDDPFQSTNHSIIVYCKNLVIMSAKSCNDNVMHQSCDDVMKQSYNNNVMQQSYNNNVNYAKSMV